MRWPTEWKDPSSLDLLDGTPVDSILVESPDTRELLGRRALTSGIRVIDPADLPQGLVVVRGEWPGVKLSPSGAPDRAAAGPTGDPWVDSNGWRVRLASALRPGIRVWVDVRPRLPRATVDAHRLALADAAACGGRWIISLDAHLAAGAAAGVPEALSGWKRIAGAAAFFEARREWNQLLPESVIGVVSDFTGPNEFLSHELLNLFGRASQQYRVVPTPGLSRTSLQGLRAVLYADDALPDSGARDHLMAFAAGGGLLISGPQWSLPADARAAGADHPRYILHSLGRGRIAIARTGFEDPYLLAADTVVLMSHRYELLRIWNAGAMIAHLSAGGDRRRAVVQMVSFVPARSGNPTVRVAGRYRSARLWTLDGAFAAPIELKSGENSTEIHLPAASLYGAVELEV
jgi:hypothetical protein